MEDEYINKVSFITPNESEFEKLTKCKINEQTILNWQSKHYCRLILTLGDQGVIFVENGKIKHIPAIKSEVKDTTGAGDTFNGVFASFINLGIEKAIKHANIAASVSITRYGAQNGIPDLKTIETKYKEIYG